MTERRSSGEAPTAYCCCFSPDGTRIAYTCPVRDGSQTFDQVFVVNVPQVISTSGRDRDANYGPSPPILLSGTTALVLVDFPRFVVRAVFRGYGAEMHVVISFRKLC